MAPSPLRHLLASKFSGCLLADFFCCPLESVLPSLPHPRFSGKLFHCFWVELFLIEITITFIALSLCRRYVFLEKNLEGKKQQYFNIGAVVLLILCELLFGEVFAQLCLFLIVGSNISLARTTHRFAGFFLVIPIAGIFHDIVTAAVRNPGGENRRGKY